MFAAVRKERDAQALRAASPARLVPVILDVTDEGTISEAFRTIQAAVGSAGLAGLVNNAGIAVTGPLELVPLNELRRQYEINVFGQVAVTQAFLPLLRAARRRIINVGSVGAKFALPFAGPLNSSKAAFESLSDSLRMELRPWGIQVVLVSPGSIRTSAEAKLTADSEAALEGFSFAPSSTIVLSVFDGPVQLADATTPWDHIDPAYSGPLLPEEILGLYYDLSSYGIFVSAGQTLRFEATTPHDPLGFTSVEFATGDAYPAGTAFVDVAADGTKDVIFKTFVSAGADLLSPSPLEMSAGTQAVSLRWPASPGAVQYRIGRSDVAGGAKTIVQTTAQTNFVDGGLLPGATYHYQVTAAGADGSTVSSEEESVQVLPMIVDQANLADQPDATTARLFIGSTAASQVVQVGKTGTLVGLELAALGFPELRLTVFDDQSGKQLASFDYPLSLFGGNAPHPLAPTQIGPAYLDVTQLGLHVVAGDRLRFEVTVPPDATSGIPPNFTLRKDAAGSLAFKTFLQ